MGAGARAISDLATFPVESAVPVPDPSRRIHVHLSFQNIKTNKKIILPFLFDSEVIS